MALVVWVTGSRVAVGSVWKFPGHPKIGHGQRATGGGYPDPVKTARPLKIGVRAWYKDELGSWGWELGWSLEELSRVQSC